MEGRRMRAACVALLAAVVATATAGAETTIGVAPFESVAAQGQGVPDVAARLAERLGTKGVDRVVGPADLGAPAVAEPAAGDAASLAARAGVGFVIFGRTTRLGNSLSVDARVVEGRSGRSLGAPIVEEASRPEDLGNAIESLSAQLLARIAEQTAPAVSARPSGAAAKSPPARKGRFSGDRPISIKSDELEAVERDGQRRFVFTGHVRASQDDLLIRSDRLEAFYPPGGSDPDRMVATGHVVMEQEGRVARCDKAVYFRSDDRIECTGRVAELEQECDRVTGDKIIFFLDSEVLKVEGAADVKLRPDEPGCGAAASAAKAGS